MKSLIVVGALALSSLTAQGADDPRVIKADPLLHAILKCTDHEGERIEVNNTFVKLPRPWPTINYVELQEPLGRFGGRPILVTWMDKVGPSRFVDFSILLNVQEMDPPRSSRFSGIYREVTRGDDSTPVEHRWDCWY